MSSTKGYARLRLSDVIARHNEIIHPGDRAHGEAMFVGLEHVEPNTGRRIGSLRIDLANLTGRKPTFREGQIVYGYLRPYLNKVWIAEFDGCSSVDQFAFDVRLDRADPSFVAAYMRSDVFLRRSSVVTTTGQLPRISIDQILAVEIELPPLAEQKRIAGILKEQLAAVERARAAAEAQLEAAKALPAAYLRERFEGHEAKNWRRMKLADVCRDISDGTHFTPVYVSDGVPFLSVKDVKETGILFDDCRFISQEQHTDLCRRCKPELGDVLYTKVGTTGVAKAVDVDREFSIFVSVALLKLTPIVSSEFVELVLNSPLCRAQAENLTQGAANRNLVLRDLKVIEIPVPPIETQRLVTDELRAAIKGANDLGSLVRQHFSDIGSLPAALLRHAFQGRL